MREGKKGFIPGSSTEEKDDLETSSDLAGVEAYRENLRERLLALDEDIPGPTEPKPIDDGDPLEEIAVLERKLKTLQALLDSFRSDENSKRDAVNEKIIQYRDLLRGHTKEARRRGMLP